MTNRKLHMPLRLVPKSATLDDLKRLIRTLLPKRCVFSEPTTNIWMKIDPNYRRQKFRPMTLVSGNIRFMRIFAEVPWGTTVGLSTTAIFSDFAGYFFENFRGEASVIIRYHISYSDTQSVVGFSVIPKCVALNDPKRLFRVKFCLRAGLAGTD